MSMANVASPEQTHYCTVRGYIIPDISKSFRSADESLAWRDFSPS
jgi:hypothetical protein